MAKNKFKGDFSKMVGQQAKNGGLRHLGIIADGNRRWAKEHDLPSIEGHKKGIDVIETLTKAAGEAGIEYLTFYVFSTENWGRSTEEVNSLMELVETQILTYAKKLATKNARLLVLGSRKGPSDTVLRSLDEAEKLTAHCTGITVCFCFNYGGEQEIADAASAALEELHSKKSPTAKSSTDSQNLILTPAIIRRHLYHPEIPDLDMIVRTSGEKRLSGFMLWRASYAEFLFLDKFFPDMTATDLSAIISEYQARHRRFGK